MRSLVTWVLATFTSPAGVFILATLDSTLFFSLPFGIDGAVIIVAARSETLAWLVPLVATAGSATGGALTFWMGAKIGEKSLDRFVPSEQLDNIRKRIKASGAVALAAVDLLPPPFPFTPVVLAAGALEVNPMLFFATLVLTRLIRFGIETVLAVHFGRRLILRWLEADIFQDAVAALVGLGIGLTTVGIVKLVRSSRRQSRRAAA